MTLDMKYSVGVFQILVKEIIVYNQLSIRYEY